MAVLDWNRAALRRLGGVAVNRGMAILQLTVEFNNAVVVVQRMDSGSNNLVCKTPLPLPLPS